jgi:hypothetical protein
MVSLAAAAKTETKFLMHQEENYLDLYKMPVKESKFRREKLGFLIGLTWRSAWYLLQRQKPSFSSCGDRLDGQ